MIEHQGFLFFCFYLPGQFTDLCRKHSSLDFLEPLHRYSFGDIHGTDWQVTCQVG
jgi:hypothetical protein